MLWQHFSISHGIELPEKRVQLNKPRKGVVRLTAQQTSNTIIIEVIDDGRGINIDAVSEEVLSAGLQEAPHIGADDTGEKHKHKNGYCTYIGGQFWT